MSMKVDWVKLRQVHENLAGWPTITEETEILFVMVMADRSAKKAVVKFKDFMNFMWSMSESQDFEVINLVVQDREGRILYRHKTINNGGEEIPVGGNSNVIAHWGALTQDEKDMYIKLLVAQIQGHEQ